MRALVVGGSGFMGSHLVDALSLSGWEVAVLDNHERSYDPAPPRVRFVKGDLGQNRLVSEALIGVDIVFHLAWSTIHETSIRDPIADLTDNVIPSIRLIQACLDAGARRIVFVSSGGTVYEPTDDIPISETHAQNPISAYGITKLAVEKYLHMFQELYGLDYAILRPSVPYGPRQDPLRRQGAVAVFLYRVGNDLPVTIWGDGSATRDYFYISDLVEALVAAAQRELDQHRVFNVGGSQEVSLTKLVGLVEKTVGRTARIEYRPARKFDAKRIVLDTRLAHRELHWQPKVSLEEGLAQTWEWIRDAVPTPVVDSQENPEPGAAAQAMRQGTGAGNSMTKNRKKVVIVCPAYNAAKTLERTIADIPAGVADEIILVDDCSQDNTVQKARSLGLRVFVHDRNRGYGANQKTCYTEALKAGADIVVMLHPDYQYDPQAIPALIQPILDGNADAVFGSRMMKGGALEGGMPLWKHNTNILLTALENVVLQTYLTEYHSGFRAYSADLLRTIYFERNSDDFVFDTQIIVQMLLQGFRIEEIPIRTSYFPGASVIRFWRAVRYGLGILGVMGLFLMHRHLGLPVGAFERKPESPATRGADAG